VTEYGPDPNGIIGRKMHATYRAVWALTTFASLMAERGRRDAFSAWCSLPGGEYRR
jgi:hypothetical protein